MGRYHPIVMGLGFDHTHFGDLGWFGFDAGSQPFLIALLGLSCVGPSPR
jgi:hypothetical protein